MSDEIRTTHDDESPSGRSLLLAIEEDGSVRVGSRRWSVNDSGHPLFEPDDEPGCRYIGGEDDAAEAFLALLRTALSTRREGSDK